jgi:hypothetical protein
MADVKGVTGSSDATGSMEAQMWSHIMSYMHVNWPSMVRQGRAHANKPHVLMVQFETLSSQQAQQNVDVAVLTRDVECRTARQQAEVMAMLAQREREFGGPERRHWMVAQFIWRSLGQAKLLALDPCVMLGVDKSKAWNDAAIRNRLQTPITLDEFAKRAAGSQRTLGLYEAKSGHFLVQRGMIDNDVLMQLVSLGRGWHRDFQSPERLVQALQKATNNDLSRLEALFCFDASWKAGSTTATTTSAAERDGKDSKMSDEDGESAADKEREANSAAKILRFLQAHQGRIVGALIVARDAETGQRARVLHYLVESGIKEEKKARDLLASQLACLASDYKLTVDTKPLADGNSDKNYSQWQTKHWPNLPKGATSTSLVTSSNTEDGDVQMKDD